MKFKNSRQRKAVMKKLGERDKIHKKYKQSTNMSYSQLKRWSRKHCSKKASLSREPIRRNLRLLKKPKNQWTQRDVKGAKKTISFIARHKNQRKGKPRGKNCPSGRTIALRNWAYSP